jgi:AcrR family transcriptional regulator
MNETTVSRMSWVERAADRSPIVQRSRSRSVQHAKLIVDAARRLILVKGGGFTTQELVKEAGVALQTFYRYFAGKDELLLAVMEDMIAESCVVLEQQASGLTDPVDRLQFYITAVVGTLGADGDESAAARFVSTEHWRLHRLYPDELTQANKHYADLILGEIHAAAEAGLLKPAHPESDAWLITHLVTGVYHHYAFATTDESGKDIGQRLWAFCHTALGGSSNQDRRRPRRSERRATTTGETNHVPLRSQTSTRRR